MAGIRSGMARALGLALGTTMLCVGCGSDTADVPSPRAAEGQSRSAEVATVEVLASWSEGDPDADSAWLEAHTAPRLIDTEQQRADFIAGLPEQSGDAATSLREVDLSTYTLVVAGFSQCGNAAQVTVIDHEVIHSVHQVKQIQCVWAPTRVEVFRVSGTSLQLRP